MDIERTHEACQLTPRPVAAMASSHMDGEFISPHHHPRAQLVHAIAGVMTVRCPQGSWVVPSGRAVWMPAGMDHSIRISGQVEMRTAFVAPDARPGLPSTCEVIEVSALLLALLVSATRIPFEYDTYGRDGRIMELILDEVQSARRLSMHVPMPQHPRLATLCERLIADPSAPATLEELAGGLAMSGRTLARLFHSELGMSFGEWRRRMRLLLSLPRLAAGTSILEVALEHGYQSPSAFAAMFKKTFGVAPSRYLDDLA
ncbi:helix-turn-helix transcriptional regulator [Bradyrhizobium sp. 33ap4]|uniref:AraC family transcriptional regulator n=1 Tax=Bradyrhizobium sp. 33ap4 TaxID=3061630 RepID=UPI00292D4DB6|nr:helix-turn-helix transcriptional regulator [Bradyrhizobium sp. 33ap4]